MKNLIFIYILYVVKVIHRDLIICEKEHFSKRVFVFSFKTVSRKNWWMREISRNFHTVVHSQIHSAEIAAIYVISYIFYKNFVKLTFLTKETTKELIWRNIFFVWKNVKFSLTHPQCGKVHKNAITLKFFPSNHFSKIHEIWLMKMDAFLPLGGFYG